MADKFHSDTQEKIETITYLPGLQNTGDLESGTHTIVPTSRPAIGSAQYSASLTLSKPSDARLVVKRIAARLSVNIAGLGTATHVYCSVRVDVDDTGHELFSEDWTSTGAKLDAIDTHSGAKSTIFDLLKDGAPHTFYFLFWADEANQATVDAVQLWEAVGTKATGGAIVIEISHTGLLQVGNRNMIEGSGSPTSRLSLYNTGSNALLWSLVCEWTGAADFSPAPSALCLSPGRAYFSIQGTVATDLNWFEGLAATLRSLQ